MRNMVQIAVILLCGLPFLMACRPGGGWGPGGKKKKDKKEKKEKEYFSPSTSWGGWSPPKGNDDWKKWIEQWGKHRTTDRPYSDEWDDERGPDSGWPQHWKGYGPGINGVPPPPWAYVPESYDKPQYCFLRPVFGKCPGNVTRWGFNPTKGKCEKFFYSGCGGNQNNFFDEPRCIAGCVATASPDCMTDPEVNFEEMINLNFG